jgi:putative tryptophan/tyrosine transport system substrate-binding protein
MRRRDFVSLLGGSAAALIVWPITAHVQQAGMPVIGYLSAGTSEMMRDYIAAFFRGLADEGFAEGHNIGIEYRWTEGHNDRLPALAADLVRRQVAVIVVGGSTPGSLAAKAATQTVPIVFYVGTDPVRVGLVASLAHPGGNITGVTNLNVELFKKCFELMHSLMPPAATIAVLVNPANIPQTTAERAIVQEAASALGTRVVILNASNPGEIDSAFETVVGQRVNALSYGADIAEPYRLLGVYAGRILKGEKPADLPVQQATKVELVINLKTAKTLGLTVPLPLLGRADQVIE